MHVEGDVVIAAGSRTNVQTLYNEGHQALVQGDVPRARALLKSIRDAGGTASAQAYELEAWCLLCEGKAAEARDLIGRLSTRSVLIAAVVANICGSDPGRFDVLAEALDKTPSLTLVSYAMVACKAYEALALAVDRPKLVLRFTDRQFLDATARLFYADAFVPCEALCLAGFRAFGAGIHLVNAACCASRMGEVDRAFDHLRRALAAGYESRASLDTDPDLANMRADRRWASLG